MSEVLRVTLDGQHLTPSNEADLRDLYIAASKASVPPSTTTSIRLVFRHDPHGTTIEPFLGSASYEALLRIAKKRDDTMKLRVSLAGCALSFCENVGVVFAREGTPAPRERLDCSLAAFRAQRGLESGWYRIAAPVTWFYFARVEAKLLQPLKLSSGRLATHFFRDFWVRTVEPQIAAAAVEVAVARDAAVIVSPGEARPGEPPSELDGEGPVLAQGRIYFLRLYSLASRSWNHSSIGQGVGTRAH